MHTFLRSTVLAASTLVACWGISGCSTEMDSGTGKMAKPMDKMGGAMDKMDTGKMDTGKMAKPMDKMDTGRMGGAMDKMDTGKMETKKP